MDNEDRIYDHVEQKQKVTSLEHKVSFTVGTEDQVEDCEQACSSQNTDQQETSALFTELKNASEKSMTSQKVVRTKSDLNSLSRKGRIDEEFQKDSSGGRMKVLDRRRTVSEGHCPDDSCESSDDSLHLPGLIRIDSSPPRMEHKERSLEKCKRMLKQPVRHALIACFLSKSDAF